MEQLDIKSLYEEELKDQHSHLLDLGLSVQGMDMALMLPVQAAPVAYVQSSLPATSPAASGPVSSQSFDLDRPLREARDIFERAYFAFHLQRENGSMTRVAEKTGLERTHLYRKLKQLGVDIGRDKKAAS